MQKKDFMKFKVGDKVKFCRKSGLIDTGYIASINPDGDYALYKVKKRQCCMEGCRDPDPIHSEDCGWFDATELEKIDGYART